MANSEQAISIDVNTTGIEEATKKISGLGKIVQKLSDVFKKVFSPERITGYFKSAVQSSGALDKELLVLRLALGKLKAAVGDAVAPIGAVFIPIVQKAVWAATRLVKAVGKVVAALFSQGAAAKNTADGQSTLAEANEDVKKSLMGFDEINRLDASDSEQPTESKIPTSNDTLSPQLQVVVDKIMSLIAPLNAIDFAPAVAAFGRLREAIAPISQTLFAGLEWAWHNLLVPLAAWTIENLLPAFLDTLASALGVLNAVIVALQPMADWLWENFLKPLALWTGEKIITALGSLRQRLDGISEWISQNPELVQKLALAAAAIGLINGLIKTFNGVGGLAIGVLGGLLNPISLVSVAIKALGAVVLLLVANWDEVKTAAVNAWSAIRAAWAGAAGWLQSNLLTPIAGGFKSMVNGIIGFLNAMIAGIVGGVNGIINAVNKLSFAVPDWIPGLGGKTIGFNLKPVNTPKIPYLAQGAVLPANRPFMAVVGDQRHGTNIEAPLDTIKQALYEVLGSRDSETVVQVNFGGDLAQLARVLKPAIELETRRTGASLAKGGVY